jgi:hypothetical protein
LIEYGDIKRPTMTETLGTLNLKIARLQQRLRVLDQQQQLSQPYPQHRLGLIRQSFNLRAELSALLQQRAELAQQVAADTPERLFDGTGYRRQSLYPTA